MRNHLDELDENAESLSHIRKCEGENIANGLTCVYESYDTNATDKVLDISAKCIETTKLGKLVIRTRLLTSVPLI